MREQYDERTTRNIFDEAIWTLEKEDVIVATNHWIRAITVRDGKVSHPTSIQRDSMKTERSKRK
jgi:hypothetical protein